MKTEVKKLDNTKREISIETSGDIVKNKFEDIYKKISQEAKVPGFRPGHAPRDILEKHYASRAHELVLKELVPEAYNQALEKEGLDTIDLPNIFDVKLDGDSLSFKAQVETYPEIEVKNYKGIKVNYKKIEVSPDEIKRSIDTLKETRKIDKVDDNFAKGLGYPDLSELEKAVKRQIYIQKENTQRRKIENGIIESIIKSVEFKIPESLVNRQLEDLIRQAKLDLALKGMPREKLEEQQNSLSSELQPEAERQVRIYLVLGAIAKKENISQDEQMTARAMEFLLKEANWKEGT